LRRGFGLLAKEPEALPGPFPRRVRGNFALHKFCFKLAILSMRKGPLSA
jgi:hypothetical protein